MFSQPRRSTQVLSVLAIVCLLTLAAGGTAVATNAFGAADTVDRILAGSLAAGTPSPTPQVAAGPSPTIVPTPAPAMTPVTTPAAGPAGTQAPIVTPEPTPTASPKPPRVAVDVNIVANPTEVFASEYRNTWCSTSGVQMTLAVLGIADNSVAFQKTLQRQLPGWRSHADSHNPGWGPLAMARALDAYGAKGYEVRTYATRSAALRDAARALEVTQSPVLLLAWRGAHTWVMTGFRADADPAIFADATVTGTYILDPWYPRVSSIWGRSDPPGTFQDAAEMLRNYLKWRRPEGHYPDRDGRYVAVVPTIPVSR